MTEAKAASLRLLTQLPVRTHRAERAYGASYGEHRGGDTTGKVGLGKGHGKCGGHNRRAILIGSEKFFSIAEAAAAMSVHHSEIRKMLRSGAAQEVNPAPLR